MKEATSKRRMFFGIGAAAGFSLGRFLVNRARRYDLRGKTCVITGGARGLGLVIARELARRGARLVLAARDPRSLAYARDELVRAGAEVLTVSCDVRDAEQVGLMIAQARSRFGAIDVLINDAGEIEVGPLETMTHEDFSRAMATHFFGPLSTSMAVIPEMRSRGSGRIVNIASIGGLVPIPHLAPYTASKFALVGLSGALRAELAKDGVAVTTVCPWLMRTGSPRNALFKGDHQKEYAWFSISDSLPLFTIAAERAAREIVDAMVMGKPMLVVGRWARLSWLASTLLPNLFARITSVANRLLPRGKETEAAFGFESESSASPSALTALSERAAERNNELRWRPQS